ncbi:MAG: hypothetical protein ABI593_07440, partial [Betaproteobacteria bacterium]
QVATRVLSRLAEFGVAWRRSALPPADNGSLALGPLGVEVMFTYGRTVLKAGAYALNELVRPVAVIATHVNEAATKDGKVLPASRTAALIGLAKCRPVHYALSGRTMKFDGAGKWVAGWASPP